MTVVVRFWSLAFAVMVALVLSAGVRPAAATTTPPDKAVYAQHKYHKMHSRIQEWHHCDFGVEAVVRGDFTFLGADSEIYVAIEKVGSGREVPVLSGKLSDLGRYTAKKAGGKLKLAPGTRKVSGSVVIGTKSLSIGFKAKTSKENDLAPANYLLPIDEPIAGMDNRALPPFTGQAWMRVYVRAASADPWITRSYLLDYSGRNAYVPNKVLPSQTLKGRRPKESQ